MSMPLVAVVVVQELLLLLEPAVTTAVLAAVELVAMVEALPAVETMEGIGANKSTNPAAAIVSVWIFVSVEVSISYYAGGGGYGGAGPTSLLPPFISGNCSQLYVSFQRETSNGRNRYKGQRS